MEINTEKYNYNITKICILCNKIFYKRKKDAKNKWKSRIYCSSNCYYYIQRLATTTIVSAQKPNRTLMPVDCENHLAKIKDSFLTMVDNKYFVGQVEHSGKLWNKSGLVDMAIEEALDLFTYLFTLKKQMLQAKNILASALKKNSNSRDPFILKAYNILQYGNKEGFGEIEK